MNIVVVSTGFDLTSLDVKPVTTIVSNNSDRLLALSDIDLALDELIYIQRTPIDWVLHAVNDQINYEKFLVLAPNVPINSDIVYLTDEEKLLGNFYCRPHVFALLGNLYKIHYKDYILSQISAPLDNDSKLMAYAIDRLGFNFAKIN